MDAKKCTIYLELYVEVEKMNSEISAYIAVLSLASLAYILQKLHA